MLRNFKNALAKLAPSLRVGLLTFLCLATELAVLLVVFLVLDKVSLAPAPTGSLTEGLNALNRFLYLIVPLAVFVGALAVFLLTAPVGAVWRALPAALLVVVTLFFAIPVMLLCYWFGWGVVTWPLGVILPHILGSMALWRGKGLR